MWCSRPCSVVSLSVVTLAMNCPSVIWHDGRLNTAVGGPLTVAGRVPGSAPAYPHASVRRATDEKAFEEYTTHRGHQDQAHAPGQDARPVLPNRRRRRPHQA